MRTQILNIAAQAPPLFQTLEAIPHPEQGISLGRAGIILSEVHSGDMPSRPYFSPSLKYVARGREAYRYAGRTYLVKEGQFLVVPEGLSGHVEVHGNGNARSLGLCVLLPPQLGLAGNIAPLERPTVFTEQGSSLGSLLMQLTRNLRDGAADHEDGARQLLYNLSQAYEEFVGFTASQMIAIDAIKAATRYEIFRRLNCARTLLHETTDTVLSLEAMADEAAMSPFQFSRHFKRCYGESPTRYHRRIRLDLARSLVRYRGCTLGTAARLTGFGTSSALSHAHRNMFGATIRG